MTNEYGTHMDSNGYIPSILSGFKRCYLCGKENLKLDRHEPIGGAMRDKSKQYGMWVLLCRNCHTDAHSTCTTGDYLKREVQQAAMECYGWTTEEFRRRFYKNYL